MKNDGGSHVCSYRFQIFVTTFEQTQTMMVMPSKILLVVVTLAHVDAFVVNRRVAGPTGTALQMGLYDTPLPPPPSDDFINEFQESKRKKQFEKWNPDTEDQANDPEEQMQRAILFQFDDLGREKLGILPNLGRNPNLGVESFYEPTDSLVRQLLRMTRCHPDDACWALEANKGNVMQASIAIALAQRKVLNDSVALPDGKDVDWDQDLKALLAQQNRNVTPGELGMDFENEGYSLGLDGLEERKKSLLQRERKSEAKKWTQGGTPDEQWLPGKPNPKPVDDEPWFTG